MSGNKCPICGKDLKSEVWSGFCNHLNLYDCHDCGCFYAPSDFSPSNVDTDDEKFDKYKLRNYLFYKKSKLTPVLLNGDDYASVVSDVKIEKEYQIYNLTPQMVENWYPKTFAEKIDKILLYLESKNDYLGKEIELSPIDLPKLYFCETTDNADVISQLEYINSYLSKNDLISGLDKQWVAYKGALFPQKFILTPKALERIYELQKTQVRNKNVFISMAFNDNTKETREAIRQGIINAGYSPEFIDEIKHNHEIVPEMLRLIRESKFLILEITEPNFGAYYEAGYALGLGKEVIVCCKKEIFDKKDFTCPHLEDVKKEDKEFLRNNNCKYYEKFLRPHFDIAQKQTLVWKDYKDLTEQLAEWIKFLFNKD